MAFDINQYRESMKECGRLAQKRYYDGKSVHKITRSMTEIRIFKYDQFKVCFCCFFQENSENEFLQVIHQQYPFIAHM